MTFRWLFVLLAAPLMDDVNWPQFRGPAGDGRSAAALVPLKWSESENVRWKTPIHGRGWSSPVVWGRQVWVTTATEDGKTQSVLCLDRETGKILLDRKLFENEAPEPLGNDVNTYASPTCAIEEGRVYVHFGSYGTACLDTRSFKTIWERRDFPCRHYRGPSSSPALYGDLLILTFDGVDRQYLVGVSKKTGKTVWKTDRTAEWNDLDAEGKPAAEGDARKAHGTPVFVTVDGKARMLSVGAKAAYLYDPVSGREIWRADHKGFSSSTMPAVGSGAAYITTGYSGSPLWAVKLTGSGNVTETNILWRYSRNVPQKPSPLLIDGLLYLLADSGVMTCLEAATGAEIWKERVGGNYSSSPLYAGGRIYCFSEQGKTVVLRSGRKLDIQVENELEKGCMATPAISGNSLLVRTKSHLYRIGP